MLLEQLIEGLSGEGFVGREAILEEIYKKIEGKAAAVVVKGPGGSGKTALSCRLAANLNKKGFSFIMIEGQTHPEIILKKIYEKAVKKGVKGAEKIYTNRQEELRKKILWFVENYLEKEKIMLIFEDFETNLNLEDKFRNERLKEFIMYLRDSLKDKNTFLFFTNEKDIPGFEALPIGEFSDEEFKKLLYHTGALKQLAGKSREKLFFDMGSNPRVYKLLDQIASREFAGKKFEWDALKNRVPRLTERVLHKESPDADFSMLLLEKMLEYLNESQRQFLKGLSLFNGPVGKEAIETLGLKISGKDRGQLIDLSLIDFYETKHLYRLHPLTARFFLGKMNEAERKALNLKAARYFEISHDAGEEEDIEKKIEARRHYLEAEEWDRAAGLTFALDLYLTPKGYVQLSYDLFKEIEDLDYSRKKGLLVFQRLLFFSSLFGMVDRVISLGEKLLKIYEQEKNRPGMAQSLGQIAGALDNKRKYDDALEKYEKSRQIYEETGDIRAAAFTLLEMGKIQRKRSKYDDAMAHFERALEFAERGDDSGGIAESLHQVAQVHEAKGELDRALEHYQKAQALREKTGDEKGMAGELHQIGNIYFLKGNLDTAFDHYQQSLQLAERHRDLRGQGYSSGQLGLIYQRKGLQDEALRQYRHSLRAFETLDDQRGISASLHQIGRIYQDQGKLDEALEHLKKSLEIREKSADMPGMATGYGQFGLLHYEKEEYKDALECSIKSFLLFSRMGAPGAKLAQQNIRKIEKKLPQKEFESMLKEYNIMPAEENQSQPDQKIKGKKSG